MISVNLQCRGFKVLMGLLEHSSSEDGVCASVLDEVLQEEITRTFTDEATARFN
jgi:hypothetical protein